MMTKFRSVKDISEDGIRSRDTEGMECAENSSAIARGGVTILGGILGVLGVGFD